MVVVRKGKVCLHFTSQGRKGTIAFIVIELKKNNPLNQFSVKTLERKKVNELKMADNYSISKTLRKLKFFRYHHRDRSFLTNKDKLANLQIERTSSHKVALVTGRSLYKDTYAEAHISSLPFLINESDKA